MQIKHFSPPHIPHNMRGKTSPIGGVSNTPQAPMQGKPTLPGNADVPQDQLAAIGAAKREPM
jgi:hypothetical protein